MDKNDITIIEDGKFSFPEEQEVNPDDLRSEILQLDIEIKRLAASKAKKEEILAAYEAKLAEQ